MRSQSPLIFLSDCKYIRVVFAFACDESLKRILVVRGQRTLYRYSAGTNSVQKDQLTSFASDLNTVLPEYMQQ